MELIIKKQRSITLIGHFSMLIRIWICTMEMEEQDKTAWKSFRSICGRVISKNYIVKSKL